MALVRRRITRKSTSILPVLFLAHFLTGAESRYVLWSLIHDSSVNATALPAGVKLASVTACARACWPDEGCEKFCYDVSEATCYMSGLLMTSEEPEPDMQCYKIYRECPTSAGYAMYGSHCLKLSGVTMKNVDGQAMCTAHGAHLYHFKSVALDSQPLLDLLAAQGNPGYLWVGATCDSSPSSCVWSDGSPLPPTSDTWGSGWPNPTFQRCVELRTSDMKLQNVDCNYMDTPVCQVDM